MKVAADGHAIVGMVQLSRGTVLAVSPNFTVSVFYRSFCSGTKNRGSDSGAYGSNGTKTLDGNVDAVRSEKVRTVGVDGGVDVIFVAGYDVGGFGILTVATTVTIRDAKTNDYFVTIYVFPTATSISRN